MEETHVRLSTRTLVTWVGLPTSIWPSNHDQKNESIHLHHTSVVGYVLIDDMQIGPSSMLFMFPCQEIFPMAIEMG